MTKCNNNQLELRRSRLVSETASRQAGSLGKLVCPETLAAYAAVWSRDYYYYYYYYYYHYYYYYYYSYYYYCYYDYIVFRCFA